MCSIGEDDYGDEGGLHAMEPQKAAQIMNETLPLGVCSKCGQTDIEIFQLSCRQPECRDCFLAYVRHKFRAALGSSKILPRSARVLLLFDGSAEALVLLDMLHHAQTQNTFKRLHCCAQVLHIDETMMQQQQGSTATPEGKPTSAQRIRQLQSLMSRYEQFPAHVISAASTGAVRFNLQSEADAYLARDLNAECTFMASLGALSSTSRQDFVKHHRSRLIGAVATQLECGFAFLPEISTTLAAQLLSAVALGRGGCAALDVALLDDRLGADVKLVRPLKDLNAAEVQLYLRARQLCPLWPHTTTTPAQAETSLQSLTKAFVDNLQQNFASTVSTVFRTGDKMAPPPPSLPVTSSRTLELLSLDEKDAAAAAPLEVCVFCNSPLDFADSTTLLAIEFSRLVSAAGTTLDKCPTLDATARQKLQGQAHERRRRLCHGCRNIQAECGVDSKLLD